MDKIRVLLGEDDDGGRRMIERFLRDSHFDVDAVEDAEAAMARARKRPPSAVIADYKLPGMDGIELIGRLKEELPGLPTVLVTAHGDVQTAVNAIKAGAFNFLEKPLDPEALVDTIRQAVEKERLSIEVERLRRALDDRFGIENILGASEAMKRVFEKIKLAAPTDTTVLVQGESGTGKELAAQAIHQMSPRKRRPFIPVNCAALPEQLVESELFGHEKGAFTGAVESKKGYFEAAEGGTLFIDEVGQMPLALQPKLLRALEQRVVTRVGATREIPVDVRIIAATNRRLEQAIKVGEFRDDLFYRLSVLVIELPPLRERKGDIALLASTFVGELARRHGRKVRSITPEALSALDKYPWPGNVRELKNTLESVVVLSIKDKIGLEDLPMYIRRAESATPAARPPAPPEGKPKTLAEVEKRAIFNTLAACGGNRTQAARLLGIGVRTIQRKLAEYGQDV